MEVFSIVLGVLLALGLSEWAEEREHRALARSALVNISQEINSNLEMLTLIHNNNTRTIEVLKITSETGDREQRSFIPGLQLQETAWEAFLASGLSSYVDYNTLLALSSMYSMQRVYKQTATQLSESAMNATAHAAALGTVLDERHFQDQFMGHFELLVQIESLLLDVYRDAPVSLAN